MKIYLNGLELGREATGEMEVGQVLSEVQSEIHNGGKVMLAASIDGVPVESGFRRRRQLATPVTRDRPAALRGNFSQARTIAASSGDRLSDTGV